MMDWLNLGDKQSGSTLSGSRGCDKAGWWSRCNVGSGSIRQEGLLLIEMDIVVKFCVGGLLG